MRNPLTLSVVVDYWASPECSWGYHPTAPQTGIGSRRILLSHSSGSWQQRWSLLRALPGGNLFCASLLAIAGFAGHSWHRSSTLTSVYPMSLPLHTYLPLSPCSPLTIMPRHNGLEPIHIPTPYLDFMYKEPISKWGHILGTGDLRRSHVLGKVKSNSFGQNWT